MRLSTFSFVYWPVEWTLVKSSLFLLSCLLMISKSFLYILIHFLCIVNISGSRCGLPLSSFHGIFSWTGVLHVNDVQFINGFPLWSVLFVSCLGNLCLRNSFLSSGSFTVWVVPLWTKIHLKLVSVCDVRWGQQSSVAAVPCADVTLFFTGLQCSFHPGNYLWLLDSCVPLACVSVLVPAPH